MKVGDGAFTVDTGTKPMRHKDEVQAWLDDAVVRLRVDRVIVLVDTPPSPGCYAEVLSKGNGTRAELSLGAEFYSEPRDVQREILAHEVVHVLNERAESAIDELIEAGDYDDVVDTLIEDAIEHSVDRIVHAFIDAFPA